MNALAIQRVTVALRRRLADALKAENPNLLQPEDKVFTGPLDRDEIQSAKLVLFLYRMAPNASLRNRQHRVESNNPPPPALVYHDALPLDLYYLLTVGGASGTEPAGLGTLGFAMRELQLNPDLVGPDVEHETVHVSLDPLTMEETSRIWALFPATNYRICVCYVATPVWIDPPRPRALGRPVVEDSLDAGAKVPRPVA